jgi:GNAT superfamily N-acetyltransferase
MIAVRPVAYDDLWAVRAVSAQACPDMWPADLARAYLAAACADRALLRRLECSRLALAWDGEEPCGLVEVVRRRRCDELVTLQVVPGYRRQGVGSALLAWPELPETLLARVERRNAAAAAFLRARGFLPVGEEWRPFGGEPVDRYLRTAEVGLPWAVR